MDNVITYPVKLYRLGEQPRTVNAQADLAFWLKEGWTLTPQVYEHRNFPRVIYHVIEGSKTVCDQEELNFFVSLGWTTEPKKVNEAENLKAKVMYHNAELEKFQQEYFAMTGEYVLVGIYENMEPIKPEPEEVKPETTKAEEPKQELVLPKKRGRKAKIKE